jgi:hypothetical protein
MTLYPEGVPEESKFLLKLILLVCGQGILCVSTTGYML